MGVVENKYRPNYCAQEKNCSFSQKILYNNDQRENFGTFSEFLKFFSFARYSDKTLKLKGVISLLEN